MGPPPRPFVPHHAPQQNIPPPAPAPSHNSLRDVRRPTPNSVTNGGNMRHNLPAGASVLRPQHRPPVPKHRPIVRPMHSPHHNMIPQDPLPIRCPPPRVITSSPKAVKSSNSLGMQQQQLLAQQRQRRMSTDSNHSVSSNKSMSNNVQVPPPLRNTPPLRGNEIASKVMENGGAYSLFPNLNITVTSAPRRSQPPTPQPSVVTLPEEEEELVEEHEIDEEEEEEEIDDDEEEELDDVEPSDGAPLNGDSALSTNASAISAAPLGSLHSAVLSKQHSPVPKPLPVQPAPKPEPVATKVKVKEIRRSIGTLKFVRTVDGKGYMRKQSDNLLQKAKATVAGKSVLRNKNKKKKKRFFKGA